MSTTTARAQMIHTAQHAAQRLRHMDDLTATVHTFLTIVQDATTYPDDSAQTCTQELQRLAGIHHPQHTGTQTYADHTEDFCSQENHGCQASPPSPPCGTSTWSRSCSTCRRTPPRRPPR